MAVFRVVLLYNKYAEQKFVLLYFGLTVRSAFGLVSLAYRLVKLYAEIDLLSSINTDV